MNYFGIFASLVFIVVLLGDIFETMVVPRRVTRTWRITRIFYRTLWSLWRRIGWLLPPGKKREGFLSIFGPLSLLTLFASWAAGLILGFGFLQCAIGADLKGAGDIPAIWDYFYLSGTTFFTLGYGDVSPASPSGRVLAIIESGMGFGFMAIVIGYLPVLYQAFSRREAVISLLDARCGSPPSAAQLLLREARSRHSKALLPLLSEWERWAAELLESHLSYPVLVFYRSQHDNQSWLMTLTTILDSCALLLAEGHTPYGYQAQLTFAMARHAAVDLALVFHTAPLSPPEDRLPAQRLEALRGQLRDAGLEIPSGELVDAQLAALRELYEPFVNALAKYFEYRLQPIVLDKQGFDNWQTSAWMRRGPKLERLTSPDFGLDDHFN